MATFGTGAIALIGGSHRRCHRLCRKQVCHTADLQQQKLDFKSYARSFVGGASGALAMGMGLAAPVLGGGLRLTYHLSVAHCLISWGTLSSLAKTALGRIYSPGYLVIGLGKLGGSENRSSATGPLENPSKRRDWVLMEPFPAFVSNTPILKATTPNEHCGPVWSNQVLADRIHFESLFVSPIKRESRKTWLVKTRPRS